MTREEFESLYSHIRAYSEIYIPKQTFVDVFMAEFADVPKIYMESAVSIYLRYWYKYKPFNVNTIKDCLWRVKLVAQMNMRDATNKIVQEKYKNAYDCLEKFLGSYNKEYEV